MNVSIVEERKAKLNTLRETINNSLLQGGDYTDAELENFLEAEAEKLEKSVA